MRPLPRQLPWWLALLAAVLGGGPSGSAADTRSSTENPNRDRPRYVRSLETHRIPPVELVDQTGAPVALTSALEGDRPVLVNFLFATCTTTCPVATATVVSMREALGPEGDDLRILSISVDPAHDTPKVLQAYARRHGIGPGWQLLTGDPVQINSVLKAFGVSAGKATHTPVTLLKVRGSPQWVRLAGFPNSAQLVGEYRRLRAN